MVIPLAEPKPTSFGEALRFAIVQEFGTNVRFAGAMGLKSPGRVSQYIKGSEDIDAATVERMLMCFSSLALQEYVYRAWTREFLRLPGEEHIEQSGEELIEQLRDLTHAGNPRRALRLAIRRKQYPASDNLSRMLTEEAFRISLRLKRPGPAAGFLKEIVREAEERQDVGARATALWMRCTALRSTEFAPARTRMSAWNTASAFIEAWTPKDKAETALRDNRRTALYRDYALEVLRLGERSPVPAEALSRALASVERSMKLLECQVTYDMGLEVRARIEISQERFGTAEETLSELERTGTNIGTELAEKVLLLRATLVFSRGERDEAEHLYEQISERCFAVMNLHHMHRAEEQLARIRLSF